MKYSVYSIFDRKAQIFGNLLLFTNDDMAKRSMADLIRGGGDSPMVFYPEDFDLYCIGGFESDDGSLEIVVPHLVARFADYKELRPVMPMVGRQ